MHLKAKSMTSLYIDIMTACIEVCGFLVLLLKQGFYPILAESPGFAKREGTKLRKNILRMTHKVLALA